MKRKSLAGVSFTIGVILLIVGAFTTLLGWALLTIGHVLGTLSGMCLGAIAVASIFFSLVYFRDVVYLRRWHKER